MSLFEAPLRFKLNVTVVALIKLSEAFNTLEIYVGVILVQEMVFPLHLSPELSGGSWHGDHYLGLLSRKWATSSNGAEPKPLYKHTATYRNKVTPTFICTIQIKKHSWTCKCFDSDKLCKIHCSFAHCTDGIAGHPHQWTRWTYFRPEQVRQ